MGRYDDINEMGDPARIRAMFIICNNRKFIKTTREEHVANTMQAKLHWSMRRIGEIDEMRQAIMMKRAANLSRNVDGKVKKERRGSALFDIKPKKLDKLFDPHILSLTVPSHASSSTNNFCGIYKRPQSSQPRKKESLIGPLPYNLDARAQPVSHFELHQLRPKTADLLLRKQTRPWEPDWQDHNTYALTSKGAAKLRYGKHHRPGEPDVIISSLDGA